MVALETAVVAPDASPIPRKGVGAARTIQKVNKMNEKEKRITGGILLKVPATGYHKRKERQEKTGGTTRPQKTKAQEKRST